MMLPFPHSPELLEVARRVVWFKPPEVALDLPVELLAYAMRYATEEDMALLLAHVGWDGLTEAIDNAPPGIIDARSWAYWNAMIGRYPTPPMPVRRIFADASEVPPAVHSARNAPQRRK